MDGPKFRWGDAVVVRADAPAGLRPGAAGLVIGVFTGRVISRLHERKFEDSVVYAVEYDDGACDIEQKWLEPAEDNGWSVSGGADEDEC